MLQQLQNQSYDLRHRGITSFNERHFMVFVDNNVVYQFIRDITDSEIDYTDETDFICEITKLQDDIAEEAEGTK